MKNTMLSIALASFLLVACQSTVAPQAVQPTITRGIVSTSTPVPVTNTPVPPTSTPVPPTATLASTPTPIPPTSTSVPPTSARTPIPPTHTPTRPPLGKIAYDVCEGDCTTDWGGGGGVRFYHIGMANADGSNAKQIVNDGISPALSPKGDMVAYIVGSYNPKSPGASSLYVANADGSNPKEIAKPASSVAWSHNGQWLVFGQLTSSVPNSASIVILRWDGTEKRVIGTGSDPTWSPDDTQITFKGCVGETGGRCGIMVVNADGSSPRLVTDDSGNKPNWSSKGDKIIYHVRVRNGGEQLFFVNADGSGKKQLTFGTDQHILGTWSPDGNNIYYSSPEGGRWGLWVMNADGTNPRRIIDNVASLTISVSN